MAEASDNPSSAKAGSPNLFGSLRNLWGLLLVVLHTRLSLAATELEEERERLEKLLVLGIFTLVCAGMAIFCFSLLIIVWIWESPYRVAIIAVMFGCFLIATLIQYNLIRQHLKKRPKFLGQTLAELRRDVEGIRAAGKASGGSSK